MNEQQMQRQMRIQNAVEQSAYTLAMARHKDDEDIAPVLARLEALSDSIQEQQNTLSKLQTDQRAEAETLKALLKPHADKELEGIEITE